MQQSVTVIIAAYNAEDTLARAIRSALSQPETLEVIVVDDKSLDATAAVTLEEAKADQRVRLISLEINQGPAAARNRALEVASADFVAVLDADDAFLPGRLSRLMECDDAELRVDNIAFVTADGIGTLMDRTWPDIALDFQPLNVTQFVLGNLRRKSVARGELGFLKPLMSRSFLNSHGLRYDTRLRLGEDYDLYLRALLAGAKLKFTRRPGYAAVVRKTSLSAQHGAAELSRMHDRLVAHLQMDGLSPDLIQAMQAHLDEVQRKRDHRLFLDLRRAEGSWAALRYLFGVRGRAWQTASQIISDKLGLTAMAGDAVHEHDVRFLLPPTGQQSAPVVQ
ncbi:glycosyltransferase family 2 protein [Tateyamaria sp. ANG-S1]|uniref:glycosyltransferase family 2 protein n=1 Tax=Tateyamaria sp. ANG-S1 TaxID=1577905 RepID=UPI00068EC1A8|nr:glycosyltransferase family 2 protein [Tateyamaria sp. ANG-S1]